MQILREIVAVQWRRTAGASTAQRCVAGLVLLLFAGVVICNCYLLFPAEKDETHFIETVQHFAQHPIPSFDDLRDYKDLNTPLPFLVFGQLEYWSGNGLVLGRYFNMLAALAIVLLVLFKGKGNERTHVAACFGLLIFPYFLGVSTHLYTDIIPALLLALAFVLTDQKRHALAALCFFLAISSRQYMVAFPLAMGGYALAAGKRPVEPAVLWPLASCLGLAAWFMFFGGFGPKTAILLQKQYLHTVDTLFFNVSNGLAFLSSVGIYFVLPEALLFRRWHGLDNKKIYTLLAAAALLALFMAFPPLGNLRGNPIPTYGYFDKFLRLILSEQLRLVVYYLLALAAVLRFARPTLGLAILAANACILLKAHIFWEKYLLPMLVVFWLLKAAEALDTPLRARRAAQGASPPWS